MPRNPEIPVYITADGTQFRRGLAVAGQDADRFKSRVAAGTAIIRGWALAASLAGAAGAAYAKKALDVADSIDKASRAADIGAERLQTLRFAADQSGIATDKMDAALAKFNVTLGRVKSGMETSSSSVAQAFERLGISSDELQKSNLTTEQTLDEVLSRLAEVSDGSEQAAIAAQLFGRSAGPDLRNLLSQGITGIRKLEEESRKAGDVIEQALITRGVEIKDKWASIMNSMASAAAQFALRAATAIDNALGFTDSGKIVGYQDELDSLADKYAEISTRLYAAEEKATTGTDNRAKANTSRIRAALDETSREMNEINSKLLDIARAREERSARLRQIVGGGDPIDGGSSPGFGGGWTDETPTSTGGGGGASSVASDYERLSEQWKTRLELLQMKQNEELLILQTARDQGLLGEQEYQEKLTALRQQHADARNAIDQLEAQSKLNTVIGSGVEILSAMGSFNEKALRAAKVAGAAQALIATWQGSAQALRDAPFPQNLAAAAAITARGLALVGAIKGVSAGGGGTAGAGAVAAAAPTPPLNVYLPQIEQAGLYSGSTISHLFDSLQKEAGDRGLNVVFGRS